MTYPFVEYETDELAEIQFSNFENTENTDEPNTANGQEIIVELPDVTVAVTGEISMHEEQEVIENPSELDDVAEPLILPEMPHE